MTLRQAQRNYARRSAPGSIWRRCGLQRALPSAHAVTIVRELLDTQRRAPVWEALAELFVGRELQEYDYVAIAQTLRASGYGREELERILRDEVAPALRGNLSPWAVPEMEGWSQETVVAVVRGYMERRPGGLSRLLNRLSGRRAVPQVAHARWLRVLARLI
ncbi:DUF7079 family protein [Trinickia sp.]|uniref:DUF7079 family protein n=1 Tax=Trinickia sp. TaxID=2571163 RepID=UPI003BEF2469